MGAFSKRTNKKFSYQPRYYQSDSEGSPFRIEPKFDKFRKTVGDQGGLKSKFISAYDDFKTNSDSKTNKTILIIITILLLLFLFIIDFDLSLFISK
nr:riboflavin synthase subunit beta [Flavobacterium sp. UBA6135]